MNTLTINKEIKQASFTYETETLIFTGTCEVSSDNVVGNTNAQINLINGTNIGNCGNNGNASVNIWNSEYKDLIDVAAYEFKNLQNDLITKYTTSVE